MRKLLIGAVALLIALCSLISFSNLALPNVDTLESTSVPTENGTRYLTQNTIFQSRIYTANRYGSISSMYKETRREANLISVISHVASAGQNVYFIRQTYIKNEELPTTWELCMIDSEGKVTSLGGSERTWLFVTDLKVSYGKLLVAGLDKAGAAVLCSYKNNVWSIEQRVDCDAINVAAGDSGVAVLLPSGQSVEYIGSVQRSLDEFPAQSLPTRISVSKNVWFACKQPWFLLAIVVVFVLLVLALISRAIHYTHKVVTRMTWMIAESLFVLFLAAGVIFCVLGTVGQLKDTEKFAKYKIESISELLAHSSVNEVLSLTEYRKIDNAMIDKVTSNSKDTIFALHGGELTVAAAKHYPFGASASSVLDTQTLDLVYRVIYGGADGSIRVIGGRFYTVCAVPLMSNGVVVGVLVDFELAEQIIDSFVSFATPTVRSLIVVYFFMVLIGYLLMRKGFRPVSELTNQMKRIANGDLSAKKKSQRNDELGMMHETMQMMCTNLSVREYEMGEIIRAYRRFVPTSLHKLLERENFMDVRFGDAKTISGSLCLFAVGNRNEAQSALNDTQYVQFVNETFSPLYEQLMKYEGELLSSDFNLSMVPMFFPRNPADALQACLGALGEIQRQDAQWKPDPGVILHYAEFLYGIAGSADRVFPFVASDELRFLNSYSGLLHKIGVPMVITESYLKKAEHAGNYRYIGFISSSDGKYVNKLYEILDAYSDIERASRVQNDKQFQEALTNYYKGDFYLARNQFLSLIRACPEDGVSCWYLMACEKLYGVEPEQVNFQLFGVDV